MKREIGDLVEIDKVVDITDDRAARELAVGRVNLHRQAVGREKHRRLDVGANVASRHGRQSKFRQNPLQRDPDDGNRQGRSNTQPRPGAERMICVRARSQRMPTIGDELFGLRIQIGQVMRNDRRKDNSRPAR